MCNEILQADITLSAKRPKRRSHAIRGSVAFKILEIILHLYDDPCLIYYHAWISMAPL